MIRQFSMRLNQMEQAALRSVVSFRFNQLHLSGNESAAAKWAIKRFWQAIDLGMLDSIIGQLDAAQLATGRLACFVAQPVDDTVRVQGKMTKGQENERARFKADYEAQHGEGSWDRVNQENADE